MASYRYERDIDPKDLQPRKQRQYTRKERWANWWDYNLKWDVIWHKVCHDQSCGRYGICGRKKDNGGNKAGRGR